jgi:hypothetical protein
VEHSFTIELHCREIGSPPVNTGSVLASAASSAAATAAAAAVTAAQLSQQHCRDREEQREEKEESSSALSFGKRYGKWIFLGGVLAVYLIILYKKRAPSRPV